jgi:transposase
MDAKKNRGVGKSDALDAHRIAMAVLPLPVDKLHRPRLHDGVHQGVRILVTARGSMSKDRTRSVNALNALVRGNDLGIDARQKLTDAQITKVSKWRSREEELSLSIARVEAVRLAKHVLALDEQLTANENQLDDLVKVSEAAPLLEETGFQGDQRCEVPRRVVARRHREYVEKRRAEGRTDKEIRRCVKRYLARTHLPHAQRCAVKATNAA